VPSTSRFLLPAQGALYSCIKYGREYRSCCAHHLHACTTRTLPVLSEQTNSGAQHLCHVLADEARGLFPATLISLPGPGHRERGHSLDKPMWPSHQLGTALPGARRCDGTAQSLRAQPEFRNQPCRVPCRSVRTPSARAHLPLAAARAPAFTPARAAYTNQPTNVRLAGGLVVALAQWHRSPLASGWFRVRWPFAPMIFEFESRTGTGQSRRLLGLGAAGASRGRSLARIY
jgi:hypothetical protein